VWSTDWLRNRNGQVQRVLAAVERARSQAPAVRRMPPTPSEPPRPADPPPRTTQPTTTPRPKSIAEVPDADIRFLVTEVLSQAGGTDPKDLIRTVAHRLGFERNGKNIGRRTTDVIEGMVEAGQLAESADDGRLRIVSGDRRAGASP
jgi:hypothetical protein